MRQLFFLARAFAALALVQPALASSAPADRDDSHDMDFSIGRWTTQITIIKDPFNKPNEQIHMTGTKVARPIWNGKGLIEEIEADGPSGHWQAANLFLYDPAAHQWSQNYVDSSVGRMERPSIGGYRDGNLEFYWQDFIGGRALLMKGTWKIFSPNLHSYEVARSDDGGRSWHTSFVARVSRSR
jgi:hypothetical protein